MRNECPLCGLRSPSVRGLCPKRGRWFKPNTGSHKKPFTKVEGFFGIPIKFIERFDGNIQKKDEKFRPFVCSGLFD